MLRACNHITRVLHGIELWIRQLSRLQRVINEAEAQPRVIKRLRSRGVSNLDDVLLEFGCHEDTPILLNFRLERASRNKGHWQEEAQRLSICVCKDSSDWRRLHPLETVSREASTWMTRSISLYRDK